MKRGSLILVLLLLCPIAGCEVVIAGLGFMGLLQSENDKPLEDALMAHNGQWTLGLLHVVNTNGSLSGNAPAEPISDETFEGGTVVFRGEVGDTGIKDGTWTFDDGTKWEFQWDGLNTRPHKDMPLLDFDFQGAGGRFRALEAGAEVQTFSDDFVAFTMQTTAPENSTDRYDVEVELER